jgi:hypothetical protein
MPRCWKEFWDQEYPSLEDDGECHAYSCILENGHEGPHHVLNDREIRIEFSTSSRPEGDK